MICHVRGGRLEKKEEKKGASSGNCEGEGDAQRGEEKENKRTHDDDELGVTMVLQII